jgi:protein O-GlcNAc transferase
VEVWSQILRSVPTSLLILKTHQFNTASTRKELLNAFHRQGIDPGRLALRGSSPHCEVLAQYAEVDLMLDPFPYSGGLTTCEALWMGVPTLTAPGETFSSRHSASHMSNVGLSDWVAADLEAYVAQAIFRASDLDALSLLRAGMRERVRCSPLCNGPRFGEALSRALRRAWTDWCRDGRGGPGINTLFSI